MPLGTLASVGIGNSVSAPDVVIRPILLPPGKLGFEGMVNQRAPSEPTARTRTTVSGAGTVKSVIAPDVVIRPIFPSPGLVNQRAPSGPETMLRGRTVSPNSNRDTTPTVVIRP